MAANVERVFVFIDGSNLYKGMQHFIGRGPFPPAAISNLCRALVGTRRLVRIMYYNSPLRRNDPGYPAQQRFFAGLQKFGHLTLKFGRLAQRDVKVYCATCKKLVDKAVCEGCKSPLDLKRYQDKGTDVNIATGLLIHGFDNQYDTAILISEDGDFVAAVQEVQRLGKRVENAYFRKRHLAQASDSFTLLDKNLIDPLRP